MVHYNPGIARSRNRRRHSSIIEFLDMATARKQDTRYAQWIKLHCVVTYEIAQQRTYEGAYLRTALTQLSFGLVILKIFGKEFAPIGTLFTVQSVLFTVIALIRSRKVSFIFVHRHDEGEVEYFTSSGEVVLLAGLITMATQVTLMVLLHRTSSE